MNAETRMYQPRTAFFVSLLAYAVFARLVPYLTSDPTQTSLIWNFSPLYAICLFGAAFYRDKRWSFLIPMATWLIGDLGIWMLSGRVDWAIYPDQSFTYASVLLLVAIGFALRRNRSVGAIAGTGLLGAFVFYLLSNFGVWLLGGEVRYPHTAAGLLDCYVQAIPFFGKTLASTWIFSAVLFSPIGVRTLEAVERPDRELAASPEEQLA